MKQLLSKYSQIAYYTGILTQIVGIITLLPLLAIILYPEDSQFAIYFLVTSVIALMLSVFLKKLGKAHSTDALVAGEDFLIVVIVWLLAMFFSSLPFLLSGQLSFTLAMFEAVSGWTTTGLSVVNVEVIPKIFLLHRSVIQFFGGVGLILVVFSVLSDTYGMRLFSAEGHSDRLLPNLKKSARIIMTIYSFYMITGVGLYVFFGMPFFDALNISMAALSTGGFAVTSNSIAYYKSIPIEILTMILMVLGNTNFAAHLLLFQRKFKRYSQCDETRMMFVSIFVFTLIIFIITRQLADLTFRQILFEVVSAVTTTGFALSDYSVFRPFLVMTLIPLMWMGGGSGSTAGGIKQYRVVAFIRSCKLSIQKAILPKQVVKDVYVSMPTQKLYLNPMETLRIHHFISYYFIIYFIGVAILVANQIDVMDAAFEIASALSTVGTSVGITTATTSSIVLWTEMVAMFFGRLEIMIVIIFFVYSWSDLNMFIKGCIRFKKSIGN